jgi:hypothetical protein
LGKAGFPGPATGQNLLALVLYVGCANVCPRVQTSAASQRDGFAVKNHQQKKRFARGLFSDRP